jgi:hypothetical protein
MIRTCLARAQEVTNIRVPMRPKITYLRKLCTQFTPSRGSSRPHQYSYYIVVTIVSSLPRSGTNFPENMVDRVDIVPHFMQGFIPSYLINMGEAFQTIWE